MTYKSPEFWAMERNLAKQQAIMRHVENARTFNKLKYSENLKLSGQGRYDDRATEITISGDLMKALLDLCANRSVEAAKTIHDGEWEANDFEGAAKV